MVPCFWYSTPANGATRPHVADEGYLSLVVAALVAQQNHESVNAQVWSRETMSIIWCVPAYAAQCTRRPLPPLVAT